MLVTRPFVILSLTQYEHTTAVDHPTRLHAQQSTSAKIHHHLYTLSIHHQSQHTYTRTRTSSTTISPLTETHM
jgi:hypothetical protein